MEIQNGYYVNLEIDMPTMIANYIYDSKNVVLQSENSLLDIGPYPIKTDTKLIIPDKLHNPASSS